ncbi:MAG: xylan 1,4-beta-xylosidase [Epulopiscium sp.]|nr:xylan 1,4-beta-xylosidase [Candidatus Epulonipiscium sp.]
MYYEQKKYDGKKEKRFETIYSQGMMEVTKILLDKETGVQYLYHTNGSAAGLTILMDSQGHPMIEKSNNKNDW